MNLILKAVDILSDWDVEVIETHHRYKKDAPSGTAIKIAEELAECFEAQEDRISYGHDRSSARKEGAIGVHAIRGGGVTGVHQVIFYSDNEKLEIKHESLSRVAFVDCLVRVIKWVVSAKHGYYTVEEVLGLSNTREVRKKSGHIQIVG